MAAKMPAQFWWPIATSTVVNDTMYVFGSRVVLGGPDSFYFWMVNGTYVAKVQGVTSRPENPYSWSQEWSYIPFTGNLSTLNYKALVTWAVSIFVEEEGEQGKHQRGAGGSSPVEAVTKNIQVILYGQYYTNVGADENIVATMPMSALSAFDWSQLRIRLVNGSSAPWISSAVHTDMALWDLPFGRSNMSGNGSSLVINAFTMQFSVKLQAYYIFYIVWLTPTPAMLVASNPQGPWESWSGPAIQGTLFSYPNATEATHLTYYALKMHPGLNSLLPAGGGSSNDAERCVFSYVFSQNFSMYYWVGYQALYVPSFAVLSFNSP